MNVPDPFQDTLQIMNYMDICSWWTSENLQMRLEMEGSNWNDLLLGGLLRHMSPPHNTSWIRIEDTSGRFPQASSLGLDNHGY